MTLNDKQARFVAEYGVDQNGTQAAIRAGYSPKTARSIAHENLTKPDIREAIAEAEAERFQRLDITADRVLEEMARLAFSDMGVFLRFDADGAAYLDLSALPPGATRLIRKITQEVVFGGEGEGEEGRRVLKTRIELHDKRPALEKLGQHLGLWRSEESGQPPDGITLLGHFTNAQIMEALARYADVPRGSAERGAARGAGEGGSPKALPG